MTDAAAPAKSAGLLRAHPRLLLCMALAAIAYFATPAAWRGATRGLIAWDFGTALYVTLVGIVVTRATRDDMARRAREEDDSAWVIFSAVALAACVSFVAIAYELNLTKSMQGASRGLHTALALASVLLSWTLLHLMFALHYAHEYMIEWAATPEADPDRRGGLTFPGTPEPLYWDFLYFSFIIGVASQTADVEIASTPMRRLALVHGVVAFFFNVGTLALTVNVAAGLF
ncbi:MAG: DUF1345 domain-containing protein [Hyphomicrobiales bacterium]|nr:DUF1345 domain-containing protein [Hyphomicrobiales bacterium]MDE2017651.1 DUF1345 domain-containing protein [Hyphomicrobiales bacterium]